MQLNIVWYRLRAFRIPTAHPYPKISRVKTPGGGGVGLGLNLRIIKKKIEMFFSNVSNCSLIGKLCKMDSRNSDTSCSNRRGQNGQVNIHNE